MLMSVGFPQLLESSMKEHRRDLEDLLSRSIQLQKRQQLLPQEKVITLPLT